MLTATLLAASNFSAPARTRHCGPLARAQTLVAQYVRNLNQRYVHAFCPPLCDEAHFAHSTRTATDSASLAHRFYLPTKLSQMNLSIADALQKKRKLAKSADCVGGANILGRECFISTAVRASAKPDGADSVLLTTRDVGVQSFDADINVFFRDARYIELQSDGVLVLVDVHRRCEVDGCQRFFWNFGAIRLTEKTVHAAHAVLHGGRLTERFPPGQ